MFFLFLFPHSYLQAVCIIKFFFFFFKQKTAYDMRISDWSSDVCSSDLENAGMRYMFTMMNNARLSVGLEGLSLAERAYQMAVDYAKERKQGRAPGAPAGEQSAIVDHPDVRRMLLTMRSSIEALRAVISATAAALDPANHAPDQAARAAAPT